MNRNRPRKLTATQRRAVVQITSDRCGRGLHGEQWQRALSYTAWELFKANV